MWTYLQLAQAIGWVAIIACSPFIYAVFYKISRYLAYKFFPRDTILQYEEKGRIVEAYYIRYRLFGIRSSRKLSREELSALGANR